jgi:integrase
MLTHIAIRNALPREKRYKLFDGGGLYLEVYPAGGRYWRLKYTYGGKDKRLSLGVYPKVSLADARGLKDKARAFLREGKDPATERRLMNAKLEEEAKNTFEAIAQEWLSIGKKRWSVTYIERVMGTMMTCVLPRLGRLPIGQVTPAMVRDVVSLYEARGCLESARKTRRWIGEVFTHAIQTGRLDVNPVAYVKVASSKVKNYPHLTRTELGGFLRRLVEYPGNPETRLALELLMLTFVRPGELRAAQWVEFDLEAGEWRVPAARMKGGIEHLVPLSRQAVERLKELKLFTDYSAYLFPNHGKHPFMSENTLNHALWLMGYKGRVVAHGFRATACSILNESGHFSADAIERQLAHAERNTIRAAYHRAEYLQERRKMMQWWADLLDGVRKGGTVTPLMRAS